MTPPAPPRAAATACGADTAALATTLDIDAGIGAGARCFRFELAAQPCSAAQARRLTHAWLAAREVAGEVCDSAALVVSELVTNALVHTSSRQIVCELTDKAGTVRVAVADEGVAPDGPSGRSYGRDGEEHGRGLLLVSAMCSAWGAHERGAGLQVWAELSHARHRTRTEADDVRGTGAEWVS